VCLLLQIYVPRIPGVSNEFAYLPDQFAFTYEDVWLTAADGIKLHAWFMWPREWAQDVLATKPTVLFLQVCLNNIQNSTGHQLMDGKGEM
jgi:abhydrolase domain-containing protein 13